MVIALIQERSKKHFTKFVKFAIKVIVLIALLRRAWYQGQIQWNSIVNILIKADITQLQWKSLHTWPPSQPKDLKLQGWT